MSATSAAGPLVPMPLETLLAWAADGLARERTVFGLPRRSFWAGTPECDLSVAVPGGRADTPLGVAAGPHTQLAHNIVVGWLAGARTLELKTVQVLDRLEIPRPCIDAPAEGYNVEWSQELRLADSLEQYVAAWALVHAVAPGALGVDAAARALAGTRFDASVGYDLAGVRSDAVTRFLDGLTDASRHLAHLRDRMPAAQRSQWPEVLPPQVVDTVTLSTFHGCPAGEIERIVEHLFARHAVNVVLKLNPTLLGFDEVEGLLHGPLGWRHVTLDRAAFERDLQWDHALGLLERLRGTARRHGRALGVKLTNTLVVRNTRGRLAGDVAYLSGAPLHPIAMRLANRIVHATGGAIPLSLSAGATAENFADAVACGFAPVTTCTDLLRPTGYRRLPRYLKALEADMVRAGVRTVAGYIRARATVSGETQADERLAARANLGAYAERVAADTRYASPAPAAAGSSRPPLALVDCESCNQCALACPNGAFFDVPSPSPGAAFDVVARAGRIERVPHAIVPGRERQWLLFADFCNDCGNCDTFCPQSGGPQRVKVRLHTSRAVWERDACEPAVLVEARGRRIVARLERREYRMEREGEGWRIGGGGMLALLDAGGVPVETRLAEGEPDTGLPLATLAWLRALVEHALAGSNPLSARLSTGGLLVG